MGTTISKKDGRPMRVFKDTMYVTMYELSKGGMDAIAQLAAALGTYPKTLEEWLRDNPALVDARERGIAARGGAGKEGTFRDYVFQRLPPKLQEYWAELDACDNSADGYRQVRMLTAQWGARVQKHLYIYALTTTNFNPSEALRKVGLTRSQLDSWVADDPSFAELAEELHWHKKNFFEGALFRLVQRGDPGATIFVNRTINKDRGYSEKLVVEHQGSVNHTHTHVHLVDVSKLELPTEVLALVLAAVRQHNKGAGVPLLSGKVSPAPVVLEGEVYTPEATEA